MNDPQLTRIKWTYTWRSFANMYDLGFMPVMYVREAAIRRLDLQPGMRVLDLACGTGLNLPYLSQAVGPTGEVVGVDYTRAMLEKAQRRCERRRLDNVRLIEADAATVHLPEGDFDRVICTHALSIIPRSREALRRAVVALRPGGRIVVADLKRLDPPVEELELFYATVVNPVYESLAYHIACAQPSREILQEMRLLLEGVEYEEHVGGALYVATGTKPEVATMQPKEKVTSAS
jgi:demethylmenaquinone methyltransferase/2-methoxy-6-polyprenyl-1,4-benzoquinol methylase